MMKFGGILIAVLVAWIAPGCAVHSEILRLPAYDAAVSMPAAGETRVFFSERINDRSLPMAAPFAVVNLHGQGVVDRERNAQVAYYETINLKPDFILIGEAVTNQSGSIAVSQYVANGVAVGFAQPTLSTRVTAVCYRLYQSRLGLNVDSARTVDVIQDESLRTAGLLEGDTLLSVNGVPIENLPDYWRAPRHAELMRVPPRTEIELVWLRSGVGRMSARVNSIENPPTHLQLPNSCELELPEPSTMFHRSYDD